MQPHSWTIFPANNYFTVPSVHRYYPWLHYENYDTHLPTLGRLAATHPYGYPTVPMDSGLVVIPPPCVYVSTMNSKSGMPPGLSHPPILVTDTSWKTLLIRAFLGTNLSI